MRQTRNKIFSAMRHISLRPFRIPRHETFLNTGLTTHKQQVLAPCGLVGGGRGFNAHADTCSARVPPFPPTLVAPAIPFVAATRKTCATKMPLRLPRGTTNGTGPAHVVCALPCLCCTRFAATRATAAAQPPFVPLFISCGHHLQG